MQSGLWVPCDPVPGAITVNIGDALQYWSDGRLKSTFHRVRMPRKDEYQVRFVLHGLVSYVLLHACYCHASFCHASVQSQAGLLTVSRSISAVSVQHQCSIRENCICTQSGGV